MKKSRILALALAVLMMVACVPVMAFTATAAAAEAPTYMVYEQDFEDVAYGATGVELLGELGWYVPTAKVATNAATYKVVGNTSNKALRVDTLGNKTDSFITVFGGDVMSILSDSTFTLKYTLTYQPETVVYDNYASFIYNYNEMDGDEANGEGNEVYGIVAVRACGTGFSAVYYPAYGKTCAFHSLEKQSGYGQVMTNRYDEVSAQPSLYALLGGDEADNELRTGTDAMVGKPMDIEIAYDSASGVTVSINGVVVSVTNKTNEYNPEISNKELWSDFISRNNGSAIALVAKPGVVADIDNISISTNNLNSVDEDETLPALLITQIGGYPKANWQEFIEIYNPNDFAVDVANYSLIKTLNAESGTAIDAINIRNSSAGRKSTYDAYANLGNVFGKKLKDTNTAAASKYITIEAAKALPDTMYDRDDNLEYIAGASANTYVAVPEGQSGTHYKITYTEEWNTRYVRGSSDYATNTMLNPGECMILWMGGGTYLPSWQAGVNHGDMTTNIAAKGLRNEFKNYGLTEDTKVLCVPGVGVNDNENIIYAIGKAVDENNQEINYKARRVTDLTDIECQVNFNCTLATGTVNEVNDPTASNFGQAGNYQANYSAAYVYGIDASSDYRIGLMYTSLTPIFHKTRSHIGQLSGYQQIIIDHFYKKTDKTPDLMITEIMPHTNDLQGKDSNAFPAMELTNTSGKALNLYDYALTRTNTGLDCTNGLGFNRAVELRAGNPVNKVTGNGSYYYFAEDAISNPESCVLQPGESVVIWFLTADTYSSYYTDDDFGFSYFRQYWVNNGCAELAVKNNAGDYSVKVIAVDGCESEAFNGENALVSFAPSATAAAVYGIAPASASVLGGIINTTDVISIACYSLSASFYELNKEGVLSPDGETMHYANVQHCSETPVNMGMRYAVGTSFAKGISGMVASLKINDHVSATSGSWNSTEPGTSLRIQMSTTNAMQTPGLGKLQGIEAYCIKDNLFRADANGSNVYRFFNDAKNGVSTLTGAALDPNSSSAYLRFDASVEKGNYSALVATYGAENVKVGMLVMMTDALPKGVALNKSALATAGVSFIDVQANLLYHTEEYAVLGATVLVNDKNYDTEYTAVSYLEVTTKDGAVHTYWSTTSTQRSVEVVAKAALKDTRLNKEGIYVNQIDGKYSPYTAAQIAQYKVFAGE